MEHSATRYNYGLGLLRLIAAFFVVLLHGWPYVYGRPMWDIATLAVPLFVLMSFYLTADSVMHPTAGRLVQRIMRLFFPYLIWPLLWAAAFEIAGALLHTRLVQLPNDFLYQYAFGSSDNLIPAFWYLWCMMILTVLAFLLWHFLPKKAAMTVTILLIPVAFVVQYTGLNAALFGALPHEAGNSLGRLAEMLPYCCMGLLLGQPPEQLERPVHAFSRKSRTLLLLLCVAIAVLLIAFYELIPEPAGFVYGGLQRFLTTLAVFLFFVLLPLRNIPSRIQHLMKTLAGTTMGIYAIHYGLGRIFYIALTACGLSPDSHTFLLCCIYFILSLIITLLLQRIASRTKRHLAGRILQMVVS